jgi:hypothetical protein
MDLQVLVCKSWGEAVLSLTAKELTMRTKKTAQAAKFNLYATGLLLASAVLLLLSGCSQTSSTTHGSLSGTVLLVNDTGNPVLDPADNAGITVALYHPAELDTTIVRINGSYPNIGVQINQQTEFDHRLQNATASATSSADGAFSISSLSVGTYNLVAFKEGWGVRYLYNIEIAEGENTIQQARNVKISQSQGNRQKSDIELYPVTELSGFVSSSISFLSNHDYLVTDNLSLTGDITFNPNAQIWVNPGKFIAFYANVSTPVDNPDLVKITSSDGMYSTLQHSVDSIQKFYNIDCTSYSSYVLNKISSIMTTFTEQGWKVNVSGLTLSNMILRYMKTGLVFNQLTSITINTSNIRNSSDPDLGGINVTACTSFTTTGLIFKDCTTGIRQHTSDNVNVSNCYFNNCSITDNQDIFAQTQGCINNLYETTGSVTNCTFENSIKGISSSGWSTTLIEYCVFRTRVGIHSYNQLNWNNSWFTANHNNFYCSQYNAMSTAVFTTTEFIYMNGESNYWGTTITSVIEEKLYDYYDNQQPDPNHPEYTWAIIDFMPYSPYVIPNAGVSAN